jgi:hypothetical protein
MKSVRLRAILSRFLPFFRGKPRIWDAPVQRRHSARRKKKIETMAMSKIFTCTSEIELSTKTFPERQKRIFPTI